MCNNWLLAPNAGRSKEIQKKEEEMRTAFESLLNKIVSRLIKDRLIEAEEAEVYRVGVEVTLLKAIHIDSYIMIALFLGRVLEFIVVFSIFC